MPSPRATCKIASSPRDGGCLSSVRRTSRVTSFANLSGTSPPSQTDFVRYERPSVPVQVSDEVKLRQATNFN